ncbi:MAG TPA: hypothetical protein PLS62_14925, partial [Desulfobacteraceae bacterium]|nr:hypothetical protein [Desulfobacteraceae bacterium]
QCLWRVYPPVFVEGLPASLCGGVTSPWLGQKMNYYKTSPAGIHNAFVWVPPDRGLGQAYQVRHDD